MRVLQCGLRITMALIFTTPFEKRDHERLFEVFSEAQPLFDGDRQSEFIARLYRDYDQHTKTYIMKRGSKVKQKTHLIVKNF